MTLPVWLNTFAEVNRGTHWSAITAGSTLIAVQGRTVSGLTAGAVKG